jgi:hypothetical protein
MYNAIYIVVMLILHMLMGTAAVHMILTGAHIRIIRSCRVVEGSLFHLAK